jgi:SagB-type dehydrogenase family enzyme
MAGGVLLLARCGRNLSSTPTPTLSPQTPSNSSSATSFLPDATELTSLTRTPEDTAMPIQQPKTEYIPKVDGSFSTLPLPQTWFPDDMTLFRALQERHSSRAFRSEELPTSILSSILWAGFGINRPTGKRTAPSANNVQDIDIYLATSKGLFRYEAVNHDLIPLLADDLRPFTGLQEFVSSAPLNLVYVSNYNRIQASAEDCLQWSWAHCGFIAQNVYLACANLGLATVVRSSFDRASLGLRMGLNANQHITLAQTIGYPA